MAITKEKKQIILDKLDGIKDEAAALVFVRFNQMTGHDLTAMRTTMREEGIGYYVAKKTLMKRTFGEAFDGSMPDLDGEIAVAYSTDAIAPAQQIKTFATTHKDKISIAGGVFQGVFKDQAEMSEIASIPALPVLHGMFANFFQQPAQGLAMVMQAVAEKKEAQAA